MTKAVFQDATQEDWERVSQLLSRYHLPLDGAHDHLAGFTLALSEDGQFIGVAGIEYYGEVGLVRSVAVADRNHGTGKALLQHLFEKARAAGLKRLYLLTTTAADYFPRFGFQCISRADMPSSLHQSAEFQGACPDTAIAMMLDLNG